MYGAVGFVGISSAWMNARVETPKPSAVKKVTYASNVAQILNNNCVTCHRPGQVAPFSLVGYENSKKWASMIAAVTTSKRMPPWKAEHGYGEFLKDRSLTPEQIQNLQDWSQAGAPRGDKKAEPAPIKFPETQWINGKPDIELKPEKAFNLGAEGPDVYRNFVMKYKFDKDTWIRGMDVQPGNAKVVHHVIIYLDGNNNSQALERANKDGQLGYSNSGGGVGFFPTGSLGGWAPGSEPTLWTGGKAMLIKKNTTLVLQVHYHKSGKAESDLTKVGLYLAKEPVQKEVHLAWFFKFFINIPPNKPDHLESYTATLPTDVTLYGLMPHMHLLGRTFKSYAVKPDGTEVPLIKINDWDFNWQINYSYKKPIQLPAGTKVHIDVVYDNSTGNPRNPNNPPKRVYFGEETTDEMFLMLGAYTLDNPAEEAKMRRFSLGDQ